MINRKTISFSVLVALIISSCGNLNYGTPYFASNEVHINQDSLEVSSDFKRQFNTAYSDSGEFSAFYSVREKDSLVKSELKTSVIVLNQPVEAPLNSDLKTVIYAETVNVYYRENQKDSIVIIENRSTNKISDSLHTSSTRTEIKTPALITTQTISDTLDSRVDSLIPKMETVKKITVTDSILTPTINTKTELKNKKTDKIDSTFASKASQATNISGQQIDQTVYKTDTIRNKVYVTDTVRTEIKIDPKITNQKDQVIVPPTPVIITKTDTVYQTKVITKIEKPVPLPPTKVHDTVYIKEVDTVFQTDVISKLEKLNQPITKVSDTVYIKERDTIFQTKIDTVRIQEIKEVLSKPVIIEKKPRIELFTITFQKNTTKGDNLDDLSAEILALCEKNKNYIVFLSGYTDKSGSESVNLAISQKRATSIRDQLIGKGIEKTKIVTQWFGEEFATEENSAAERIVKVRVELTE